MDSDVRGAEWKLDIWGPHADEHGQPYIRAKLFRVTADLADWADTLPDGLLKVIPALTPLPATRPIP